MTQMHKRLPKKRCSKGKHTPLTIMTELWDMNLQFATHHVNNARAFSEDYIKMLPKQKHVTPLTLWSYGRDAMQRSVLFLDAMRQRGNNFMEHQRAGNPPVLKFDYDIVQDGSKFERPVNYSMARILPPEGVKIDPKKRPFMIVDPRAGHGPGIGGFKPESQVGVALQAGHPVYFVIFKMHPVPGQTLRDVAEAEIQFLSWIAKQHPNSDKPVVLGNCQGGWAVMGVAAAHPELTGPLVLSGAPLSYWAGVTGKNPMRYLGGLCGGSWLAYLMSDIGNGEFDGANLVANFEALDPANSFWKKYHNLYANIDTEVPRFLDFELWWGGYMFLTASEMRTTLDNLFIGNKLSRGQISIDRNVNLDLSRIQQPIIIFCSQGDNITPPQQALNWIADVYKDELAIKAAGQTIVYMIHETTGHLGIFVSSAIIGREHAQITATLEQIESLPPGLYEMSIIDGDNKKKPTYDVRLEERTIKQLLAEGGEASEDEDEFQLVKIVSEFNGNAYEMFLSPLVRKLSNPLVANVMRTLHPMRVQHWALSDINPMMRLIEPMARYVTSHRKAIGEDNPLRQMEEANGTIIEYVLNSYRDIRDVTSENMFYSCYGLLSSAGFANQLLKRGEFRGEEKDARREALIHDIVNNAPKGDFIDGVMRMVLLLTHARQHLSRSEIAHMQQSFAEYPEFKALTPDDRRARLQRQTVIVAYHPEVALESMGMLFANAHERQRALKILKDLNHIENDTVAGRAMRKRITDMLSHAPKLHIVKPAAKPAAKPRSAKRSRRPSGKAGRAG